MTTDREGFDPIDIKWESVHLKCHSQYEVLGLVLSILGRAPCEATRSNHHLPLLILYAKFVILAAGNKPKKSAPHLVSIMFTEDDGDLKLQVAVNLPVCPELEDPVIGPGLSTVAYNPDLNIIMGSTILQGRTDLPDYKIKNLRKLMQHNRYDFLENEGGYGLPGKDVVVKVSIFSAQRVSVPNPLLGCEKSFGGERHAKSPSSYLFARILSLRNDVDSEL